MEKDRAGKTQDDPTIQSYRENFKLPTEFVNETQKHIVTAAPKQIERMPKQRQMEFTPARPIKPSKNDILKAIRKYRFQSIKTQPFPMYLGGV